MPDDDILDLSTVQPPAMRVVDPDGKTRTYDLFLTAEKLGEITPDAASNTATLDRIRRAFDFPTAAEAAAKGETPLHPLLCLKLVDQLTSRIGEVEEVKKASALVQKSGQN